MFLVLIVSSVKYQSFRQPRPQGLLLDDFQNGGSTGEDPGKGWYHVVQNLQKSWRFLSRDILRKAKTKWRRRGSKTPVKVIACKYVVRASVRHSPCINDDPFVNTDMHHLRKRWDYFVSPLLLMQSWTGWLA